MPVDSVRERLIVRRWDPTHRNMTQLENVNINGRDKTTYIESCTTHAYCVQILEVGSWDLDLCERFNILFKLYIYIMISIINIIRA